METIRIIIEGEPQVKQRPRFKRINKKEKDSKGIEKKKSYVLTYTPNETLSYEKRIKEAWTYEMLNDIPLSVHIVAYFGIPKSFPKYKRAQALSNIIKPTKKDIDNICKVVLDGLQGVAYNNDSYVTDLVCRKRYSEWPRVEIEIKEVKE